MSTPTFSPATVTRATARLVLGGLAVTSAGVAGSRAWALRASRGRVVSPHEAPRTDVAVVLGCGLRPDGRPSIYLAARLDRALELVRLGRARVVVVSGAALDDADEPRAMREYLVEHGVDPRVVVEDREGIDTYATCRRARRVYGLHEILLVSQGYHLPRALAVAGASGLDAVGVADWSVRHHPLVAPQTWGRGEVREWLAGLKVLADVARPRREDDPDHDPSVDLALAAAAEIAEHDEVRA